MWQHYDETMTQSSVLKILAESCRNALTFFKSNVDLLRRVKEESVLHLNHNRPDSIAVLLEN